MGKIEAWECKHMRRWLLAFVAAGTAGTAVGALLMLLFRWVHWGEEVSPGILVLAWIIAGAMLVPLAFHKGTEQGRQRQQQ